MLLHIKKNPAAAANKKVKAAAPAKVLNYKIYLQKIFIVYVILVNTFCTLNQCFKHVFGPSPVLHDVSSDV